jgi:hypothetical protein
MAELQAQALVDYAGNVAEATPAEEQPTEEWIVSTQNTLGRFVEKPRLMADRLRKPPFRFLFDVAVEVARQTGFGLSELFRGDLSDKPKPPSSRDEKIAFLETWRHLLQWALGPPTSGDLMGVLPVNVVCGAKPEWTNYMLQCTAAAAWPNACASMRPATAEPVQPLAALAMPSEHEAAVADVPVTSHLDGQAGADVDTLADGATSAPPEPASGPVEEDAPLTYLQPDLSVEQAREIAAGMDFRTTMDQFHSWNQEFATSASDNMPPLGEAEMQQQEEPHASEVVPTPLSDENPTESVARVPLQQAQVRVARVDEEVRRAEDLLNEIEAGFERTSAGIQEKRRLAEEKHQREQDEAEAAEREAAEAEMATQMEEQRRMEEKIAKKAARKAEKERIAAEEAAKPVYPVSKYSTEHGTRAIAANNDSDEEEYEWDGDDDGDNFQDKAEASEPIAPLEGAAAFDLSAVLGDDPRHPKGFDDHGGSSSSMVGGVGSLFDKLKMQLKETFVSYLCASMPASLLKKYRPGELVGCLQFLLTELRRCIAQHSLEDVGDEEPTTLAEDLRGKFPNEWVEYLQGGTPSVFCHQYDVPELLDTLQSLAQICLERLEDSLGPLQSWTDESSPLHYVPPAEPLRVDTPPDDVVEGRLGTASDSGGLSSAGLPAAPWEMQEPVPTVAVAAHRGGLAATFADFRHRPNPNPAVGGNPVQRIASPAPAPTFDATLGPAIWEQQLPAGSSSYPPVTGAGPHAAMRHGATGMGERAVHTAAPHAGAALRPGPATSHGTLNRHLGRGPVIASR